MGRIGVFFATLLILFPFLAPVSNAQMGWMMGGDDTTASQEAQNQQSLQTMVQDLLQSQHVSSVAQLDCSKIPDTTLEKLGDSWMDVMHPNEQTHEAMDNMMGGEGSDSLAQSHIQMAKNYLGCSQANGFFSMMKGGVLPMMGWDYGYGGMMQGGWGVGFGFLGLLFWAVVFVDLVLLGVFLWKKIKK